MAVTSITGAQFTVTVSSTDYSEQVVSGTINTTYNIQRTKTLSGTDFSLTDLVHEVEVEFFYDEETGMHGIVNTAAIAGTGLVVTIVGGDAKWTGTLYTTGLEVTFSADGVAMSSGTFIGSLTLADQP